jgi:hypothetical protein
MVVVVDRESRETPAADAARRRRPLIPVLLLVAAQLGLIALTLDAEPAPEPVLSPDLEIPASVATPLPDPAEFWQPAGLAAGDVLRPTRIPGGYAFTTRDGVVVLLDEGGTVRSKLPELTVFRGITADDERVVVYGSSSAPLDTTPTLWVSEDGLSWSTVKLPWRGAVRTVGFDQGRLLVNGVRQGSEGLVGVLAREADNGEWEIQDVPVPTSNHFAIDGAFVVRARIGDDADYLHYATSDFETFTYFADAMLIMSGNESAWAGVVDQDGVPALRIPQLDAPVVPPDWPIVSIWLEGGLIWIQTPLMLWSSDDGENWDDFPLTGQDWLGPAMAIPLDRTPRVAVAERSGLVRIYEWQNSN